MGYTAGRGARPRRRARRHLQRRHGRADRGDACGRPVRCPHGWPVDPDVEQAENRELEPLSALEPGARATIVRLAEHDGDLLHWFYGEGLTPGTVVELRAVDAGRGPVPGRAGRQREGDRREGRSGPVREAPPGAGVRSKGVRHPRIVTYADGLLATLDSSAATVGRYDSSHVYHLTNHGVDDRPIFGTTPTSRTCLCAGSGYGTCNAGGNGLPDGLGTIADGHGRIGRLVCDGSDVNLPRTRAARDAPRPAWSRSSRIHAERRCRARNFSSSVVVQAVRGRRHSARTRGP